MKKKGRKQTAEMLKNAVRKYAAKEFARCWRAASIVIIQQDGQEIETLLVLPPERLITNTRKTS